MLDIRARVAAVNAQGDIFRISEDCDGNGMLLRLTGDLDLPNLSTFKMNSRLK
ncbi:MAG: hypothetical protein U5R06_08750 [candidate division KSB1 bacterium]|nr:hypothetical protein [candidate division KSB1 bacterium]